MAPIAKPNRIGNATGASVQTPTHKGRRSLTSKRTLSTSRVADGIRNQSLLRTSSLSSSPLKRSVTAGTSEPVADENESSLIHAAPGLEEAIETNSHAPGQPNLPPTTPRLAPRPPTAGRRNAADVIERCFAKFEEAESVRHTQRLESIRQVENAIVTVGADVVRQANKTREESAIEARVTQKVFRETMEDVKRSFAASLRETTGSNKPTSENEELIQKAMLIQDYVKLMVCLELIYEDRGHDLFMLQPDTCNEFHAFLFEGAKMVLSSDSEEDAKMLLLKEVSFKTKSGETSDIVAAIAMKGQGRAHENIRNHIVEAFWSALPQDCPLMPTTRASKDAKKEYAEALHSNGNHRTSPEFESAWFHASHSAVNEAIATALSSAEQIKRALPNAIMPCIPEAPESDADVRLTLFSMGFVVMKVTKALQKMATTRGGRMNKSHEPSWITEVMALNDDIGILENEQCCFGSVKLYGLLLEEEVNALTARLVDI